MSYDQRLRLLKIIAGGVSGEGCHKDGTFSVEIPDKRLSPYYGELVEGGIVIDGRSLADHPDLVHWVFTDPMPKASLYGAQVDRFKDSSRESAKHMIPGLKGMFQTLAVMMQDKNISAFDFISPEACGAIWSKRGAKVGIRKGDNIEWENGEITPIPPFEKRYINAK